MDQLEIKQIDDSAGDKEMLNDGVGNISYHLPYFKYAGDPIWIGEKNNDQPGDVNYGKE